MSRLYRWFKRALNQDAATSVWTPPSLPQARPYPHTTTFDISPVEFATTPLPEVSYKAAIEAELDRERPPAKGFKFLDPANPIEACACPGDRLIKRSRVHPLLEALLRAFADHRPVVLSPDMLWILIAQGFAAHVDLNAERLRHRFVTTSGRQVVEIRRDDFIKGSPNNPWPEVFDLFAQAIRAEIGAQTHDLLIPTFSTTCAVDRAAAQIVLMASMKRYFEYRFTTLCGIPRLTLEGTETDWQKLAAQVQELGRFELDWWTESLAPILAEFVFAARGEVRIPFWQSMFKWDDESGGPHVSGWILKFFPYLHNQESEQPLIRNPWLGRLDSDLKPPCSVVTFDLPGGLARTPFLWRYLRQKYPMEFIGGFVGVRQDRTSLALRPEIGWAVRRSVDSHAI